MFSTVSTETPFVSYYHLTAFTEFHPRSYVLDFINRCKRAVFKVKFIPLQTGRLYAIMTGIEIYQVFSLLQITR